MTVTDFSQTAANHIGGESVTGSGTDAIEVFNPATGEQIAEVASASTADVDAAVAAAAGAFEEWSSRSLSSRVRVLQGMKALMQENVEHLAHMVTLDHGKTLDEARNEVSRAAEFIDTALAAPMLYHGKAINVSGGIDARNIREPLGVCAAVTPSNFPVMNPTQFSSWALVCGNTLVIKASEQDPLASSALISLFHQAGLPKGVLNLLHGRADVAKHLITHPDVAAVACITSSQTAKAIYEAATAAGNRVQANGGAKNPIVVAADADLDLAAADVVTSAFGMAGQRCLAGTRIIAQSEVYDELIEKVKGRAQSLIVGNGTDPRVTMGPVITAQSKARVEEIIQQAADNGADIVLDGREVTPEGGAETAGGYFIAPTIITGLDPTDAVERQEFFGPVIAVHRVGTLDEAIDVSNDTEFGNAATIYTRSGSSAKAYEKRVRSGNIGVNAFPAPPANMDMGGYGTSFYGDIHVTGEGHMRFFTDQKLVVSKW
jgi:malonate-semialdehyde dehydrogenase (acetylating)/methylmalonate-semialdehyde dehydrogenase